MVICIRVRESECVCVYVCAKNNNICVVEKSEHIHELRVHGHTHSGKSVCCICVCIYMHTCIYITRNQTQQHDQTFTRSSTLGLYRMRRTDSRPMGAVSCLMAEFPESGGDRVPESSDMRSS
jgi:hypothetical protein